MQSHAGMTTNIKYWFFTTCALKICWFQVSLPVLIFQWPYRRAKQKVSFVIDCFFSHNYVISQKGSKLRGKKHAEHCLTHLNKTTCEIWSVFDKVHFWVKYLMPFLHWNLQFLCSELTHSKQTTLHAFDKCHSQYLIFHFYVCQK